MTKAVSVLTKWSSRLGMHPERTIQATLTCLVVINSSRTGIIHQTRFTGCMKRPCRLCNNTWL